LNPDDRFIVIRIGIQRKHKRLNRSTRLLQFHRIGFEHYASAAQSERAYRITSRDIDLHRIATEILSIAVHAVVGLHQQPLYAYLNHAAAGKYQRLSRLLDQDIGQGLCIQFGGFESSTRHGAGCGDVGYDSQASPGR
jgi:hypothetical protein